MLSNMARRSIQTIPRRYHSILAQPISKIDNSIENIADIKNTMVKQRDENNRVIDSIKTLRLWDVSSVAKFHKIITERETANEKLIGYIHDLSSKENIITTIKDHILNDNINADAAEAVAELSTICAKAIVDQYDGKAGSQIKSDDCTVIRANIKSWLDYCIVKINAIISGENYNKLVAFNNAVDKYVNLKKLILIEGLLTSVIFMVGGSMMTVITIPLLIGGYIRILIYANKISAIGKKIKQTPASIIDHIEYLMKYPRLLSGFIKGNPHLLQYIEEYDNKTFDDPTNRISIRLTKINHNLFKYLKVQTVELAEEVVRKDSDMIKYTDPDIIAQSQILQRVASFTRM